MFQQEKAKGSETNGDMPQQVDLAARYPGSFWRATLLAALAQMTNPVSDDPGGKT